MTNPISIADVRSMMASDQPDTDILHNTTHVDICCTPEELAEVIIEAVDSHRTRLARHLLLRLCEAKSGSIIRRTIRRAIRTPDEMVAFIDLYWSSGKRPLSNQMKKGLAKCFHYFSHKDMITCRSGRHASLRHIFLMVRPKPSNETQSAFWKQFAAE